MAQITLVTTPPSLSTSSTEVRHLEFLAFVWLGLGLPGDTVLTKDAWQNSLGELLFPQRGKAGPVALTLYSLVVDSLLYKRNNHLLYPESH